MNAELRRHYAGMDTEELLQLASLGDGLLPEARQVLLGELQLRGVAAPAERMTTPPVDDSPQAERSRAGLRVVIGIVAVVVVAFVAQVLSSALKTGHLFVWILGMLAVGVLWVFTKGSKTSRSRDGTHP